MMLIFTRWGILAALIPLAFIVGFMAILAPNPLPAPVLTAANEDEDEAEIDEALEKQKLTERKKVESEHEAKTKTAKKQAYAFGCILSAGAIWPLGRWLNRRESRLLVDPKTNESLVLETGGGNTFMFVPMDYWAFIWPVIGLLQLMT